MTASIKIREEDKERLEALRLDYSRLAGRKMTLQDVLSLLIRKARIPLDELTGPMPQATEAQMARLESRIIKGGRRTNSESIDEELYGRRSS